MIAEKINDLNIQRICINISGMVQGVGFRPFVFRLAKELGLAGFVRNDPSGVFIEAEGPSFGIKSFLERIRKDKPRNSHIQNFQYHFLDPDGFDDFRIMKSDSTRLKTAVVSPDIATCRECLNEVFDPSNRRYLYPFTNCTHCGPRYSIIESLPYDRINTSMKKFNMCPECQKEYSDVKDRRFHAQPNACPQCGPKVELWNAGGETIKSFHNAVIDSVNALKKGKILAVKGIGGFHLMVDARNEESVRRLRQNKNREEKPFAVMFPSIEMIEKHCFVSAQEKMLLESCESPIVILKKRNIISRQDKLALSIAPGNPCLGALLPYSPLHYIILKEFENALVATSGNLSEEPICIDEKEAIKRLAGIAEFFLVHDRPIVRSIDDSVVRVIMDRPCIIRRARGYAPLPVMTGLNKDILSVGGHLKNTVALNSGGNVFISQHIGDLQTKQSLKAFNETVKSLKNLYESSPGKIVCDLHPDYLSTKYAEDQGLPLIRMQHHHAHIVSCMAENRLECSVLGIAWDGAGYGSDGSIWGGEFLKADLTKFQRAGHFEEFLLPGGDRASVEPRRVAASILFELSDGSFEEYSDMASIRAFSREELIVLKSMLIKRINTPVTSSVGRLFDALASLLDIKQVLRYEGQGAMGLEYIIEDAVINDHYDFSVSAGKNGCYIAEWKNMFRGIIADIRKGTDKRTISARFHNTLVEIAVDVAQKINEERVVLSGGCFQNRYLTEKMIARMRSLGFKVYWHQMVPPNDGGISLGQAVFGAGLRNTPEYQ